MTRASRLRTIAGFAPWFALLGAISFAGLWWSQQYWLFRLLATAGAAFASVWLLSGVRRSDGAGTRRRLLLAGAAVLALLAINGLAFGVALIGLGFSAIFGCASAMLLRVALGSAPATQDRWLAAVMGVTVGLAVAEGGVRFLRFGENVVEVDDEEYVRRFHHAPPPNSAYLSRPAALDEFDSVLIETNSMGIRGPEIPPGPVDLLLIGDSMVEARQLPWDQTVSARLPEAFRLRSMNVRSVAHGVRGWSPLLEWNWYLKAGRALEPRIVLLFFFWNDLWVRGDEVTTFQAVMTADGRPDYFDIAVEPRFVWFRYSRAARITDSVVNRLRPATVRRAWSLLGRSTSTLDLDGAKAAARRMMGDSILSRDDIHSLLTKPLDQLDPRLLEIARSEFWPSTRPMDLWPASQKQAVAKAEDVLRKFAEDVAADGGRLVIVHVPNAYQIAPTECSVARYLVGLPDDVLLPEPSGLQSWLRDVGGRLGIEVIDPSEAMQVYHRSSSGLHEPLYLRADCHWSARGHQFMADYLADWYLAAKARR
jgi:hypothetical protein